MPDFKRLIGALQSTEKEAESQFTLLVDTGADLRAWEAFIFGKHDHMHGYEDMMTAMYAEYTYLGSVGLFRPALASLRSFFELSIAWVYYCDHKREWAACQLNRVFFLTPGAAIRAVEEYSRTSSSSCRKCSA